MHWIYLIHEFHNLSWITEINELFHDILIYWDAPVNQTDWDAAITTWTDLLKMQIHSLPAGGALKRESGELEVSPLTAVDKAALSLQTLLYQAYNMQDEKKMTSNIF